MKYSAAQIANVPSDHELTHSSSVEQILNENEWTMRIHFQLKKHQNETCACGGNDHKKEQMNIKNESHANTLTHTLRMVQQ